MLSTVQSWLVDVLHPDEEEQQQVKVTVRLDAVDFVSLREVATHLGMSPTATAGGLLSSAISEAYQFLGLSHVPEQDRREALEEEEGVPA